MLDNAEIILIILTKWALVMNYYDIKGMSMLLHEWVNKAAPLSLFSAFLLPSSDSCGCNVKLGPHQPTGSSAARHRARRDRDALPGPHLRVPQVDA